MRMQPPILAFLFAGWLMHGVLDAAASDRKFYLYPHLSLTEYTSARYIHYPDGDIDGKRAFYWGRVLGCDGVAIDVRFMFPQLVEGNWYEPLYVDEAQRAEVYDRVTSFQSMYAAQGCADNFLHLHGHEPLHGESVEDWRSAVLLGMRQRAELLTAAGVPRIMLDMEYCHYDVVSMDPQFWYDLGRDIMANIRDVNPALLVGVYPSLMEYWIGLSESERERPRSTGSFPEDSSIPEERRFMRHALYEGMYNNRDGMTMWLFEQATYGPSHLCYGTPERTYLWNLEERVDESKSLHEALLGPGIEAMYVKYDLGAFQEPPVYTEWKQPNQHVNAHRRNYEVIYARSNYAAAYDDQRGWDEDGSHYLTYGDIVDFYAGLDTVGLESGYQYDSVTGEEHHIFVPEGAPRADKLTYFDIRSGPDGYHVAGKLAPNFTAYVDDIFIVTGKKDETIPLATLDEFKWAIEYKRKGFFQHHELVWTPKMPGQSGYLKPWSEIEVLTDPDNDVAGDFTGDGLTDLAQGYDIDGNGIAEFVVWPGVGDGRFVPEGRVSIDSYFVPDAGLAHAYDCNNDGRAELIQLQDDNGDGRTDLFVRPNLGDGYVDVGTSKISWGVAEEGLPLCVVDFNGDGLADLARAARAGGDADTYDLVVHPNQNGFWVDPATSYVTNDVATSITGAPFCTVDMNGDGAADLVQYRDEDGNGTYDLSVRANSGGWHVDEGDPVLSYDVVSTLAPLVLADFDDDGFVDVIQKYQDRGTIHLELFVRENTDGWHIVNEHVTPDVMMSGVQLLVGEFSAGTDWLDVCEISDDNGNGIYDSFTRVNLDGFTVDTGTAFYLLDFLFDSPLIGQGCPEPSVATGVSGIESPGPPFAGITCSPNPARDVMTIAFALPTSQRTSLAVYDIGGRKVATLTDGDLPAGRQQVAWDLRQRSGDRVAPGIYFAQIGTSGGLHASTKILILR